MKAEQATVHIVDDDEAFRESVCWLLDSAGLNCKQYSSAAEFLSAVDSDAVGCVVTDLRMPGMSGLELQKIIIEKSLALPIILMTAHGDVDTAVSAMKRGAIEFIQKPFKEQAFIDMVNAAIVQSIQDAEALRAAIDAKKRLSALSVREREVLDLIVDGLTNRATAGVLNLSEKTVEVHRASIMQKLDVNSLAHLMKFVLSAKAD